MKNSTVLVLLASIFGVGCKVSTNEAPPAPGRWQVIQTEYNLRNEKQPILLDTSSGETWIEDWNSSRGYYWRRVEKKE